MTRLRAQQVTAKSVVKTLRGVLAIAQNISGNGKL